MNIVVLVNVESIPGRWESKRSSFMTIVFKLKDKKEINETKEEGKRIVFFTKDGEKSLKWNRRENILCLRIRKISYMF